MIKILILITLLFAFTDRVDAKEAIVERVNIAGDIYKDMIVNIDTLELLEEIKVNKCISRRLNDFGKVEIKENEIIISEVKKDCLDNKNIDLSFQNTFTPQKSTSFFLNISPELFLKNTSKSNIYLNTGIHAFDTFFYSTFSYKQDDKFKKEYMYVERDIDEWRSVLRFGDTYANTNSFLVDNQEKNVGLLLQRKWILDPAIRPYSTVSKQLILTSKSVVEILQNNSVIYRTELPAGAYNLTNLPAQGVIGTYTIRVTDAFGRVTETTEQYVASQDLLKKDMFDYSVFLSRNPNGFMRYGLTDNLTAGLHINKNKQSISVDYLNMFGQSSLELSTKKDYRLAHTYNSQDNFSVQSLIMRKDKKNTLALSSSYATDYGSFSTQIEKTDKLKAALSYNKAFYNINTSFTVNTNSEFLFNSSYSTKIFNKNVTVGASLSHTKTNNRFYAYLSMPLSNDLKTWGLNSRVSKNKNSTSIDTDISARYLFDYAFKNRYDTANKEFSSSLNINAGLGCVKQNGDFKCNAGSSINSGQGFVLSDGTVRIEGIERQGLNTINAYKDIVVSTTSDLVETETKIAARAGQGVLIQKQILVYAKIKSNERYEKVIVNDKEVFVTEDNTFSFTTNNKKIKIVLNNIELVKEIDSNEEIVEIEIEDIYTAKTLNKKEAKYEIK